MRIYFLLFFLCGLWVFAVINEDAFKKWLVKQIERLRRVAPSKKDKWGDDWCSDALTVLNGKSSLPRHQVASSEAAQRINSFRHGKCPHCGQTDLRAGPTAPGAQNVLCGACGSKFNNTIMGIDLLRDCTDPIPEISDSISSASSSGHKLASHNREGPILRRFDCIACTLGATHNNCPDNGFDPAPVSQTVDSSVPPPGARRAAIEATKKKRKAEGRS